MKVFSILIAALTALSVAACQTTGHDHKGHDHDDHAGHKECDHAGHDHDEADDDHFDALEKAL